MNREQRRQRARVVRRGAPLIAGPGVARSEGSKGPLFAPPSSGDVGLGRGPAAPATSGDLAVDVPATLAAALQHHQAGRLAEADMEGVARAILGREELGSTGIGQGVAVPHTRHPTVDRLLGTVARSRHGVDFAALDGEPVDIFFLLISPPNQPGDHLRALENISRHLKDERFVNFLRQAKTREAIVDLLEEADQGSS